jgi:hypothetical protein
MTRLVFVAAAIGLVVVPVVLLVAEGPAFADSSFSVKVDAPAATKAKKGVAKIHITPGPGFHVNKEYPAAAKVVAPAGVTVDKDKVPPTKVEEAGMDFEVGYTANEAGKKTFTGELKFAVCSSNSCDPKKEALNFTVDVK